MVTSKDLILDISVNLARLSDWVLSESEQKQLRAKQFLKETEEFVLSLSLNNVSVSFQPTLVQFKKEFEKLLHDKDAVDKYEWAERALTWANILQHRAKLA